MVNSFTVGCDEIKDTCESCREVFGTAVGLKDHQCSFLPKNDVSEPMDFNKQISNDARNVVQALVGHVIDNGLLTANGQPTVPAPPRADIQGWHILRIIFKKSSPVDKIGLNWIKLDKSGEQWIKLIFTILKG